jgi:hypothetical protein
MRGSRLFAIGCATAVLALAAGCGGDTETTTVAGPVKRVTTTVTVPGATITTPKEQGGAKGSEQGQDRERGRAEPNFQAPSGGNTPQFRPGNPGGGRFRQFFGGQGGGEVFKCIRKYGPIASGKPPSSPQERGELRAKVRACVQRHLR